jgi:predicted metal-dependent peptidase
MFNETISKCIIQVKRECHFFGALMLFAEIYPDKSIDTAATDGKKIIVNENFLASLKSSEQNALLLHEVLHMALLHVTRRGQRDGYVWNIAADIVVNDLIIRNTKFKLPQGAIIEKKYKDKSVEHIYEDLLKNNKYKKIIFKSSMIDILDKQQEGGDQDASGKKLTEAEIEEVESFWRDKLEVLKNADQFDSKNKDQGSIPGGMGIEIESILEPEVDWRHALWKYVGKTPADFDDLDRRFFYRGLYLEGLLTEALEVSVCIDTSGSVSDTLLEQFLAELKGILRSYPHVKCDLFYGDTELFGPYPIQTIEQTPKAMGRGGTSFRPFFKYLQNNQNNLMGAHKVSIYFTDGYGDFPSKEPEDPTMWLVCKDGLESKDFPFGEVVRISTESFCNF